MMRLLLTVACLVCFGVTVNAGTGEERFVTDVSKALLSAARRGTYASERSAMERILRERMNIAAVTRKAFGKWYQDMSVSEVQEAEDSLVRSTAVILAAALEGTETVEVDGSEGHDPVFVRSMLKAPVDGLRDGIPVIWTVDRDFGISKIIEVNVAGRSAIGAQMYHINQLFEISHGNLRAVLAGMGAFGG